MRLWWFVLLLLLLNRSEAVSEYFAMGCGYNDGRNSVQSSHTFFRYAEVIRNGNGQIIDVHFVDISWLPADYAATFHLPIRRVTGRNFSLEETFALARTQGMEPQCFGPYPTTPQLYFNALNRKQALDSGAIGYKLFEPLQRRRAFQNDGGALHCIHANSDLGGFLRTGFVHGVDGTQTVINHFARNGFITSFNTSPEIAAVFQGQWQRNYSAPPQPPQFVSNSFNPIIPNSSAGTANVNNAPQPQIQEPFHANFINEAPATFTQAHMSSFSSPAIARTAGLQPVRRFRAFSRFRR